MKLEAHDVSFAYDAGARPVLDGVSLAAPRGAIVGLLGPNGSGKTTLLRLLSGTLTPARGRIWLEGTPVAALSRRDLARRIAVVPQETHSAFDFSALEIVMMGRYPHLGAFELEGAADLAIAREALAATGTTALESRRFATLSGGEKQRVVIASALAQAPDVLLLDEPTISRWCRLPAQTDLRRRIAATIAGFGALTLLVCVAAPLVGTTSIHLSRVFDRTIPFADNVDAQVFFVARLPRVLAAILVGSAFAVAGVVFQAFLRNPLASPDTLGVSSGATLGAVVVIT